MAQLITGVKTAAQIEAMRAGGKILARIFDDIRGFAEPGRNELEVDHFVADKITEYGAIATYRTNEVKFPGVICISVNDEIVHGVPSDYVLQRGDIASFDLVITYDGMKVDAAFTIVVGEAPKGAVKHLISQTERSLYAGIDAIHGPVRTGDISEAIESVLAGAHLGIIRELVGHGVGLRMHMPPDVPNYGRRGEGKLLLPGDTIAIEPMATLGGESIVTDGDGWTISTRDGSLAAHFEHTVLITETGAEILTQL